MSSKLRIAFQERLEEVNAYLELLTVMDAQAQQGQPRIKGAADPITPNNKNPLFKRVSAVVQPCRGHHFSLY